MATRNSLAWHLDKAVTWWVAPPNETVYDLTCPELPNTLEVNEGVVFRYATEANEGIVILIPRRTDKAATERAKISHQITTAAKRMIAHVGAASLTALLQLLKRELSGAHDTLRHMRSEADYLSIVTLVENALAGTNWRKLTEARLNLISQVTSLGETRRVTYADVQQVRRDLIAAGLLDGPAFDYGLNGEIKPDV
jgi:hypothetical protein